MKKVISETRLFRKTMKSVRQVNNCNQATPDEVLKYMRKFFRVQMDDCTLLRVINENLVKAECLGYLAQEEGKFYVAGLCPKPPACCPYPAPPSIIKKRQVRIAKVKICSPKATPRPDKPQQKCKPAAAPRCGTPHPRCGTPHPRCGTPHPRGGNPRRTAT